MRQMMGHTQFGARVVHGDCLFSTVPPNEQQSALVLLLSRFRDNDPHLRYQAPIWSKLARADFPVLEAKRRKKISDAGVSDPVNPKQDLPADMETIQNGVTRIRFETGRSRERSAYGC